MLLIGFAGIGFAENGLHDVRANNAGMMRCGGFGATHSRGSAWWSGHCSIAGASTMTSTGYGAIPKARMWLSAKCWRQIGGPGHSTFAGVKIPLSARHSEQHVVSGLVMGLVPLSALICALAAFPSLFWPTHS